VVGSARRWFPNNGDQKGTRSKAAAAPATVSGESVLAQATGYLGKAKATDRDPQARRPANVVTQLSGGVPFGADNRSW